MQGCIYLGFLSILASCSCIATPKQKPTDAFGWVMLCDPDWEAGISCGTTEPPNSRNCEYNCGCDSDGEVTCEKDFGKCPSGQYSAICGGSPFSPCKCHRTVDEHQKVVEAAAPKEAVAPPDVLVCDTKWEAVFDCGPGKLITGKNCVRNCTCDSYGDVDCPAWGDCQGLFYSLICRQPCECEALGTSDLFAADEGL